MAAVCTIGDLDLIHCSQPVRAQGSVTVFAEGVGISRQGDLNGPHLLPGLPCPVHAAPITLGSTNINPGETTTAIAGMTQLDVDNVRLNGNVLSTTDSAGALMWLDPGNNMEVTGKVIIRGDLQVDGTQTQINSSTLTITDKEVIVAQGAADSAAASGSGLSVDGSGANLLYQASTDTWDFNKSVNLPAGKDFTVGGVGFEERVDDRLNDLIQVGEGLDIVYADGSNTLTFSAELATASNPGVASFSADFFTVDGAGGVIIHEVNGGTY